MVELALSLVALAPLAYGIVTYGTSCLVCVDLMNAVRAGARYGSTLSLRAGELGSFKESVRLRTAESKAAGLTPEGVTVEVEMERGAPRRVRVTAEAQRERVSAVFPYLGEWEP